MGQYIDRCIIVLVHSLIPSTGYIKVAFPVYSDSLGILQIFSDYDTSLVRVEDVETAITSCGVTTRVIVILSNKGIASFIDNNAS